MSNNLSQRFEFVSDLTGFRAPNAHVVRIGGRLRRKQDLLRALATGLKLPKYFGHNWDALEECLRDLSWMPADASIVLLHEQLPLADEDQRKTYIEILRNGLQAQKGRLRIIFPARIDEKLPT